MKKRIFKTYNEVMEELFPNVFKKEKEENEKRKPMEEIAKDIMKKF